MLRIESVSLENIVKENQVWKDFADKMNEILRSNKEEKVKYWEIEKAFREAEFESDNVEREMTAEVERCCCAPKGLLRIIYGIGESFVYADTDSFFTQKGEFT